MEGSSWKQSLVLVLLLVSTYTEASFSRHMLDFIRAVKQVEEAQPHLEPVYVLRRLRRAAGPNDAFIHYFLGSADSTPELDPDLSAYIRRVVKHQVTDVAGEEGVVLTPDGTTVALAPLLLGLEAGFMSTIPGSVRGLYQLTVAAHLNQSEGKNRFLGPDGCWDNITTPQVFRLSDSPGFLTTAQIHGAMDGVLLALEVSDASRRPAKLSDLLMKYFCHQLQAEGGLDMSPRLISRRRRDNFRGLLDVERLSRKLVKAEVLQRQLKRRLMMNRKEMKELEANLERGVKEFAREYLVCPPIIPRCMWEAEPYRGTPTNLSLPLSYLFIHHTYIPGTPCLTFEQCSADMRSMQHFHQDERGWDDIGYSFVAGSDGYLYEGRGWHWQGAHTLGHNSIGYGVSFIGDYNSSLPSQHSMGLVRDRLAYCAVSGGRLKADFTLQGHRQVVDTTCPGEALYQEIRGWKHFGEVRKMQ